MARSFRALLEPEAELPAATVRHARSGRTYVVLRRGGRLIQQRGGVGLEATHVIGSGNHARTYFHLTEARELIELPLTWYAQENRWYLSPGFDRSGPPDFTRRADDTCLFCHNGYPLRNGELARGIDCRRCHGEGTEHAELASGGARPEQLRAAIVNPARLPGSLQMDVCAQCHLETTSVELPQMLRRFERDVFSFRPGEALGSYMVHFDSVPGKDRFEIVNQVYRLRQSACFLKSAGRLTCLTCHNPHSVPRGEAALVWHRAKCLLCHPTVNAPGHSALATSDCAGCHMPKRRTEDAVHVIMTDHRIARRPRGREALAPRAETARSFAGPISVYSPNLSDREGDQYLGAALIIGGTDRRRGIELLDRSIDDHSSGRALAVLAEGRLAEGDAAGAVRDFRRALERGPRTARLRYNLAQALETAEQFADAGREFEEALRLDPVFPEAHYAYANHLLKRGEAAAAIQQYEAAIRARPVYAEAFNNLGNILAARNDIIGARERFEQALRIDPGFSEAHENEARMLAAAGQVAEAVGHARRAVELKPDSSAAHYNLAQLLQTTGRIREAISEYRRSLALRPDFAPAHFALGSVLGDSGLIDAAIEEFRTVLQIEPQNSAARNYLDMALVMRGR
jgi:tetratricopeptide (TPR) repeat protein